MYDFYGEDFGRIDWVKQIISNDYLNYKFNSFVKFAYI